jgi:glycerol-3-phosphate acyltransferase PlsY
MAEFAGGGGSAHSAGIVCGVSPEVGLQTIIDDYSSNTVMLTLTFLASAYAVTIAAVCIFSILKIAFGGVRP